MLRNITPVILTSNEGENIGRTLAGLTWARDVVIVDSLSTDATAEIASQFKNVRLFQRPFEQHAEQWNFAVRETGIGTDWVLALDADYLVTPIFVEELAMLEPGEGCDGFKARFTYCIFGRQLSGTLYPELTVLFRKSVANYVQIGHTQRLIVPGSTHLLNAKLLHDDRKPLGRWMASQLRYAGLEVEHILSVSTADLRLVDKIRRMAWPAPFLVFLYTLFIKRCIFDGWAGWYYVLQRTLAEIVIALEMVARAKRVIE